MRTKLFLLVACAAALLGCGADPNEKIVITSGTQYRETLDKAYALSADVLKRLDQGEELTSTDRSQLAQSALLFDSLADYQPTNIGPFTGAGKCYQALGKDDEAIKRFRQGLAAVPSSPIDEVKDTAIETHHLLSLSLFNTKQYREALDEITRAIDMYKPYGGSPIYFTTRASVLVQMGRYDEARKDIDASEVLDPTYARADQIKKLLNLTEAEKGMKEAEGKIAGGDVQGAVALYSQLLERAPTYGPLLLARAKAYLKLGNKKQAAADLKDLKLLEPDNEEAAQLSRSLP